MQARVRGEVHQGDPAQLRGQHKHGITKDIKLTNLMPQLEYETKCRPVHKRICHATVGYGYVHGEKIIYFPRRSNYCINSTTGRIRRAASRVRGGRSHHGYSAVSAVHRPEPVCEVLTKQVTLAGAFSRRCDQEYSCL